MLKVLSILSVILIGYSFSNYTFFEIERNLFVTSGFNFSIFAEDFIGILFYGIDSFNKFLIEIELEKMEKIFIFKNKDLMNKLPSKEICGCGNCSNVYVTFIVRMLPLRIVIKCRNYNATVYLNYSVNQDQFVLFPKPKDYNKNVNKSSVWIGNIGNYIGHGNIRTLPISNQMVGCVDKFHFDDEQINMRKHGDKVLPTCKNEYTEIYCNSRRCKEETYLCAVDDCSISVINTRYCHKDLPIFEKPREIIMKEDNLIINYILKIIWITNIAKEFCLMELKSNESHSVLFHIKQDNKLVMTTFIYNESNSKDLSEVTLQSTNILLINYQDAQFILQVASQNIIKKYIFAHFGIPNLIKIGSSQSENICETYNGSLEFQHKIKKQGTEKPPTEEVSKYRTSHFVEITAFAVLSLLVIFFLINYLINLCQIKEAATPPQNPNAPNVNDNGYDTEDGF